MKNPKTTHTPGRTSQQWELWPNYINKEICVGSFQPHSNLVSAAAIVPYMDKEEGFEVARLIASAPELLAALEAAVGAIWLTGDRFTDHKAAVTDKARAAIAKAKGQQ